MEEHEPSKEEMIQALYDVVEYITSGRHYEQKNPYAVAEVKFACEVIAAYRGKVSYLQWDE